MPAGEAGAGIARVVRSTPELQAALAGAAPGVVIEIRSGLYAPPQGWNKAAPLFRLSGKTGVLVRAEIGARMDGLGRIDTLLEISDCANCEISGLSLTHARRAALVVTASRNVTIRECVAVDCTTDRNLIMGQFRVVGGACDGIAFRDCAAIGGVKGFELREVPTLSAPQASVPPKKGNIHSREADMPESEWANFKGYAEAPSRTTFCGCVAYDNNRNTQHSDGFSPRYGRQTTIEDSIALWNGDDGFDGVANVDLTVTHVFSGWNGNLFATNLPTGGNGNGIKCGVRGGLRPRIEHSVCVGNANGGITFADGEHGRGEFNFVVGSRSAISCEAGRSAGVTLTLSHNVQNAPSKLVGGARANETGAREFAPERAEIDEFAALVKRLCETPPVAGRVAEWRMRIRAQTDAWMEQKHWRRP